MISRSQVIEYIQDRCDQLRRNDNEDGKGNFGVFHVLLTVLRQEEAQNTRFKYKDGGYYWINYVHPHSNLYHSSSWKPALASYRPNKKDWVFYIPTQISPLVESEIFCIGDEITHE